MATIIAETCAEAHEVVFDFIANQHREIDIQTHIDKQEFTLEYPPSGVMDDFITVKITDPLKEPQISAGCGFGPGFTDAYKKQFLTLTPKRADGKHPRYTYWNRLADFSYRVEVADDDGILSSESGNKMEWVGDGDGRGLDQVGLLITKLLDDPNTRRGIMVTWNPLLDATNPEPPCMDLVQVVVRDGIAHMRTVFRSQDMLSGAPENFVGEAELLKYIALRSNARVGTLTNISLIPHIYKRRDSMEFHNMRVAIDTKKRFGQWHPRVIQ